MKETTYNKYKRQVKELEKELHEMKMAFKNYINANNLGYSLQRIQDLEKWFLKHSHYHKEECTGKLV